MEVRHRLDLLWDELRESVTVPDPVELPRPSCLTGCWKAGKLGT